MQIVNKNRICLFYFKKRRGGDGRQLNKLVCQCKNWLSEMRQVGSGCASNVKVGPHFPLSVWAIEGRACLVTFAITGLRIDGEISEYLVRWCCSLCIVTVQKYCMVLVLELTL